MFKKPNPKQNFPELEREILEFWRSKKIFEKSVKKGKKDYIFYDGPPFATGLPHYGHILASTIKDVIPRYYTMQGYKVERKWGWDCHGLPVENEVEKELGLGNKTAIENFGVDKFNEACRSVVLRYSNEWKKTISRMGRWADMENDYKTMDPDFMESIWWVFKSLWEKGYIYEGHKVVPYCPRCATPLSNFETNQGYKDKQDPALTVKFEVAGEPGTYLLAWTTTPWTLPSNLALAVGPNITYAKIKDAGETYILALDRIGQIYKDPAQYEVLETFLGSTLEGKKYKPLLPYFADKTEARAFTVTTGDFVSIEDGTGIVHMAPFGEDDMATLKKLKIQPVYPLDAEAKFTKLVPDYAGKDVFAANPEIIKRLKDEGKIVKHDTINHSYPFCWRCDTALIYRPISTWFVKVEELKEKLLKNNQKIHWVPDHIKDGRFGKWLEGARDWAISRNRYWGTPLPIWRCECGETKVMGSIKELEKSSKKKVKDLHKHFIDPITLPCDKCKGKVDITFVRHGETDYNVQQRWAGSATDSHLTENGIKQAEAAAQKLKKEKFDLIICSPMSRAQNTAKIINKELNLEIITEEGLTEQFYGDWEGQYNEALMKTYDKNIAEMRKTTPPNGESFAHVVERVEKVINKYIGKKILMIAHGHVYFAAYSVCHQKHIDELVELEHKNAKPYPLTYNRRLKRVPEVLDCWFESGSMPYAQLHYPFENKAKFEKNFPAEFIAEGLDQTRGWFYTLHILGTALFEEPAFKNCVVNGIVLAEDGQKMSKRLKNYPDPNHILETYGADAMRFYLMNSPVVKADDLRFSEKGVEEVIKNMLLPVWNAYSFFVTYANIDGWKPSKKQHESKNKLDRWILAELSALTSEITENLNAYDLQKSSSALYAFVDNLTNWYIRRSRRRFWKSEDNGDKKSAYATLYKVLTTLAQLMAPFMPFISEEIYRNLTGEESVHLSAFPKAEKAHDQKLIEEMFLARTVVSLGLTVRAQKKIKVRQPLSKLQIALGDDGKEKLIKDQLETIQEELNVKEIELIKDASQIATILAKPNAKLLGPKYGKEVQNIIQAAKAGKFENLPSGGIKVGTYELTAEEIEIAYQAKEGFDVATQAGILVGLDTQITPELEEEGLAREIVRQIQDMRKEADYQVSDRIEIALIKVPHSLIKKHGHFIKEETLATMIHEDLKDPDQVTTLEEMTLKIKRL
jgi:isoleucyl-tRNA synthetase